MALSAVLASAVSPALGYVPGAADVINPSLASWFNATKTGRADMFLLGDSMVWHSGDGWDAGLIDALKTHTGLAASGLLQSGVEGDGYQASVAWQSPIDQSASAVRADRRGYVWRNGAMTAGSTPAGSYGMETGNTLLSSTSGFDFRLYTVPTDNAPDGGQFDAYSRLFVSPWTPYSQTKTYTVSLPATGLQELTLHYDVPAAYQGQSLEMVIPSMQNMSILYSRIVVPGAKGASLTSWGYGGHDTLQFYNDYWNGQGVTPDGRKAFFDALTEGGSGKLNLVIEEGFNDRGETAPSLAGTTPGNSPQAFGDNVKGLMAKIRSDWTAAGRNLNDLTFTLLGTYEDYYEAGSDANNGSGQLHGFSYALQQIALSDPQVSFIDLLNHAPQYNQAVSMGYMYDEVHAATPATQAYGDMIIDTLQSYAGLNTTSGVPWKTDGNGKWSAASNWNGSVPNGTSVMARFAEAATSNRTITLDVPVTLGTLQMDNPNGYTIAGTNTLTLSSVVGNARINIMSGAHTIAAPVKLNTSTIITVPSGGKLTIAGDMTSATGAGITKVGHGELDVKHLRTAFVNISGGSIKVLPNGTASGVSYINGLSIDPASGGALDLANNDLVLEYTGASPFTSVQALVLAGFSQSVDPTKTGIVSSTSQQDQGREILALFDNAVAKLTQWPPGSGHTVSQNVIIGKYTYFGDLNMDGKVTGDDYATIDANFGDVVPATAAWITGDTNMDGRITADDYGALDANFGLGTTSQSMAASGAAAVPEPLTTSALGIMSLTLLRRRRR